MISNTSPIIFLAKINSLYLLKELYGKVKITSKIKDELLVGGKPDSKAINIAIQDRIIIIKDPNVVLPLGLGDGENSAISLASELKEGLIIDDAHAIKAAAQLRINTLRTTTVIFTAVKKKIITRIESIKLVNKLIEEGYYIAPKYYKDILDKLM